MSTTQVSAPVALAVSIEDIQTSLKLDAGELAEVMPTISLAVRGITQEAEHKTQRSFICRKRRVTLDRFPDVCRLVGAIQLDMGPVQPGVEVKFIDTVGAVQTLDPQDYDVDDVGVPSWCVPGMGKAWPATRERMNAVTVDYTAGYGDSADDVPECAQQYILLRLADLWDPATREFKDTPASKYADRLLDSLVVWA